MKTLAIRGLSIVLLLFLTLFSFSQTTIEGKWKGEENGNTIEIFSQDNMFFGKIINISNANPNIKVGHLLLNNLVFNNPLKKYEGKMKLPSGNTAKCEIELINENKFRLTATKLFIRKTQFFNRI